ncbi:hypothetical protein BOSEA31B_14783 [Hyphomicrobiales bacterium]|nr:hypothetical protein BOSEA31B_14783 [Hyphomicrobiales bacterium]CAH1701274.1 hypothetical protein BOSEA1005_20973 [Hyphomicrobiales bacterium]CAI0345236.1 hypothetical protein BO1005MUT1_380031 [Hyphomicrobiales bacterium]
MFNLTISQSEYWNIEFLRLSD